MSIKKHTFIYTLDCPYCEHENEAPEIWGMEDYYIYKAYCTICDEHIYQPKSIEEIKKINNAVVL